MIEKPTINQILKKLSAGELEVPAILSNYVVQLSASLYTSGVFELDLEMAYLKKWEEIKTNADITDKLVDAKAKQTEEYRQWKKAQIANKTILETIRALKKKLRNLEMEYQSGQNY